MITNNGKELKLYFVSYKQVGFEIAASGKKNLYVPKQAILNNGQIVFDDFEKRKDYIEKQTNKMFIKTQTKDYITGVKQLPKNKVKQIIICAGEKDMMCLRSHGFYAVCFLSESTHPTAFQIKELKRNAIT